MFNLHVAQMPPTRFGLNLTVWEAMLFEDFNVAAVAAIMDVGTEHF